MSEKKRTRSGNRTGLVSVATRAARLIAQFINRVGLQESRLGDRPSPAMETPGSRRPEMRKRQSEESAEWAR